MKHLNQKSVSVLVVTRLLTHCRVAYENIPSYYFMSQSFQSSSRPHVEPRGPLHNKCTLVQ